MTKTIPAGSRGSSADPWKGPPLAVLWDQSLLWGILCVETLRVLRIPFRLVDAQCIQSGGLGGHRVLVVPGGWASHKAQVLGDVGRKRILEFLHGGGSYLGFCGGAGLALAGPHSLGLTTLKRMPLAERLPNASGEVWLRGNSDHPVWKGLPAVLPVFIWWPAQFQRDGCRDFLPLASYYAAGRDFWVADLPMADLPEGDERWSDWERIYGINLNPERILGHDAVVQVQAGRGTLILSYPHLETPESQWGNTLLLNTLHYLDQCAAEFLPVRDCISREASDGPAPPGRTACNHLERAMEATDRLIAFGERHLLWRWRLPWLLQWRRGIRGLEYSMLAVGIRYAADRLKPFGRKAGEAPQPLWDAPAASLAEETLRFCRMAQDLLFEEKLATQSRHLTKLGKVNATVDRLRAELFGEKVSHGGLCRSLFDQLDRFLFSALRLDARAEASGSIERPPWPPSGNRTRCRSGSTLS